jgi:hypothetical protein
VPYKTFKVHLVAGRSNIGVLGVPAALADRYGAGVIGIAACEPTQIGCAPGDVCGTLMVAEQQILRALVALIEKSGSTRCHCRKDSTMSLIHDKNRMY